MTGTDKIQAIVDAELRAAYDRGVTAGLRHFDRLHAWVLGMRIDPNDADAYNVQFWADQEVKDIAEKYPRLTRPSNWAV